MWSDNEKPPIPPGRDGRMACGIQPRGRAGRHPSPPLPRAPIALYDELDASDAKRSTGAAGDPLVRLRNRLTRIPKMLSAS